MAAYKCYYKIEKSEYHTASQDFCMYTKISFLNDSSIFLAVLADGMGGLLDGEKAARLAVETVLSSFHCLLMKCYGTFPENYTIYHYGGELKTMLCEAIQAANRTVYKECEAGRRMGTTLSAVLLAGNCLLTANIGDSPIYYYSSKNNKMSVLSELHNAAERDVRDKKYERYSPEYFEKDNQLYRYIGKQKELTQDMISSQMIERIYPDDMILMCSDGAAGYQKSEDICRMLQNTEEELALETLFYAARNDKMDDQSAVWLKIVR